VVSRLRVPQTILALWLAALAAWTPDPDGHARQLVEP